MMTRFMMWCYTWVLVLVVMMAGTGAVENPNGHVVAGVVVMYTGCGMMIVATIQLVRKKR